MRHSFRNLSLVLLKAKSMVAYLGVAVLFTGCAAGPAPNAFRNRTFYEFSDASNSEARRAFEQLYPPLSSVDGAFVGVEILQSAVRFARPIQWQMRSASQSEGSGYVQYVSPKQLLFSIYERVEPSSAAWSDIQQSYESETRKAGAQFIGKPIPAATWNGQARKYEVSRSVKSSSGSLVNHCHEYLVRGKSRVVLVQIVSSVRNPDVGAPELLDVLNSVQVL